MNYTIKEIKFGENRTVHVPVFSDPSSAILQEFLSSEVQNFKSNILEVIEKAKNSSEKIEFAGNVCILSIEKGSAKIECAIDEAEIGEPVEIGLVELEQVVKSWIKDTQK
ncbi:hypothetical protein [Pseudobutyrivibrio sp.]|jgi:hypothetical protein|uniref:hypothetical protein n=1 Tax=Pseudobutyrivibrio sp. TaxID=2014367 RepID=UPI0025D7B388|nr:hypothetical protein [Pseudobutyrivibrio sp.]